MTEIWNLEHDDQIGRYYACKPLLKAVKDARPDRQLRWEFEATGTDASE